MVSSTDLPSRLRDETAELHRDVEDAVGLPGSLRTRGEYGALLNRLCTFHASVEDELCSDQWASAWMELDIDIAAHRRVDLLENDLARLGDAVTDIPVPSLELVTFAQALGCLYVMEGSALGGRVLAPAIRAEMRDVPTAFYESEGRNHPTPWRAVQSALRRFDEGGGNTDQVLLGASMTFGAFGRHLASRLWSSNE